MNEQQILASTGRSGWTVQSKQQVFRTDQVVDDATGKTTSKQVPTGEWKWVVTDGKGHSDEIYVKTIDEGPIAGGGGYEITRAPNDTPKPPATQPPPTPGDKWQAIKDDQGNVIAMQDPVTGDKVAVPRTADNKPQLVRGDNGKMYSWDGTTLAQIADTSTPEKPQIIQGQNGKVYAWDGTKLTEVGDTSKPDKPDRVQVQNGDGTTSLVEFPPGGGAPRTVYTTQPGEKLQVVDWPDGSKHGILVKGDGSWKDTGEMVPSGNPAQGTKRQNVLQGQVVTEISDGKGGWTVDPTVEPRQFVPDKPEKPTTVQTNTTDQYIVTRQPDGSLKQEVNPNYQAPTGAITKSLQDYNDALAYVKGLIEKGLMTPAEAETYMAKLRESTTATVMGTTSWNQHLEAQRQKEKAAETGRSVLADRVNQSSSLATILLGKIFDAAGKGVNFDFSKLLPFTGAGAFVDERMGGQGVMSASAQALMGGLQGGPPSQTGVTQNGLSPAILQMPRGLSPSAQALITSAAPNGARPAGSEWGTPRVPVTPEVPPTPTGAAGNPGGFSPENPPPGYVWDPEQQTFVKAAGSFGTGFSDQPDSTYPAVPSQYA